MQQGSIKLFKKDSKVIHYVSTFELPIHQRIWKIMDHGFNKDIKQHNHLNDNKKCFFEQQIRILNDF